MAPARTRSSVVSLAAIIDVVLVLVFVLIGRSSHDEGFTVIGTLQTWWPFLVGLAVGWIICLAWRHPLGLLLPGIVIWVTTVVIGMLLRAASDQGVEVAFVVVASVVLGVFLLGWRAIALAVVRLRSRRVAVPGHTGKV